MLKLVTVLGLLLSFSHSAHAGMTVYGLNDVYRLRFEEISFFVVLLLLSALGVKLLWNYATNGFSFLPRLTYPRALGLSVIFGMAMLLILTMISGIREVLTPGAWRKQGTSYRLNDPSQEPKRLRTLQHLRGALFQYAQTHNGKFPAHDFVPEIPDKLWESPDEGGTHYIYFGGYSTNDISAIIAVEPVMFGDPRYVLTAAGEIKKLPSSQLENAWKGATEK